LQAAPADDFRILITGFLDDPKSELTYPYLNFRLEPIRTTGQIHVLKYVKPEASADHIPIKPELIRLLKHFNPVYVFANIYRSFRRGIDGIHYVCEGCGASNPLLNRKCLECGAPRPKLKRYTVFIFSLRALIDMTYVLYVVLVLSFLVLTLFGALRFLSRHSN
jgi:hypothetical protein